MLQAFWYQSQRVCASYQGAWHRQVAYRFRGVCWLPWGQDPRSKARKSRRCTGSVRLSYSLPDTESMLENFSIFSMNRGRCDILGCRFNKLGNPKVYRASALYHKFNEDNITVLEIFTYSSFLSRLQSPVLVRRVAWNCISSKTESD